METQGLYIISTFISVYGLFISYMYQGARPRNAIVGAAWLVAPFLPVVNTLLAIGYFIQTAKYPFYAAIYFVNTVAKRFGGAR